MKGDPATATTAPPPRFRALAQEREDVAGNELLDRRYVTAALMLVMSLASLEMMIASTAMPTIIGELHGLAHYSWVASIYLLASTVTMPLYGRLADAWGRKRVVLAAIAMFTAGSLLAGTSRSMTQLILFRGLQGLGAGGVMPVVLTILGDVFTVKERARIQGLFSAVWGTAALAGPPLGAVIVKTLGWRWIFYVNFPFALLSMFVLMAKYRDVTEPHKTPLDLPGAALLTFGCGGMLVAASLMGTATIGPELLLVIGIASAILLAAFVVQSRRADHPILPLGLLLTDRAIAPPLGAALLMGLSVFGIDTYVPLYVQGGRGGGVTQAAGVVTPVMLMWATSSLFAAPLIVRWGFRRVAVVGAMLTAIGTIGLVVCTSLGLPSWATTVVLAITGAGFGPSAMAYLLSSQNAVDFHRRGIVTSSISFCRCFGGAVGIGMLGAMFNLLAGPKLHALRQQGVAVDTILNPTGASALSHIPAQTLATAHGAIAGSLTRVFVIIMAAAIVQLLLTLLMRDQKPEHAITPAEGFEAATG